MKMVKRYGEYIRESVDLDIQLLYASGRGDLNKVEELLDNGADKDAKNDYGLSPLMYASSNGETEVVKLLLDSDADKNAESNDGRSPLLMASQFGYTEVVKLLLEYGADKEAKSSAGQTPLILASSNRHTETVKLLLEHGANINTYDKNNNSCVDYKCEGVWTKKYTQELIITGQPQNIKFFSDKIGILPSLKLKYKEVIEMSEMGIFG